MYLKVLATKYILPQHERNIIVSVVTTIVLVLKSFQQDIIGLIL